MKKPFAENVKGTVIIDRRVYKDILKENLALMNKLDKAIEALKRIGTGELITTQRGTIFIDRDETTTLQDFALDVLKEIEE